MKTLPSGRGVARCGKPRETPVGRAAGEPGTGGYGGDPDGCPRVSPGRGARCPRRCGSVHVDPDTYRGRCNPLGSPVTPRPGLPRAPLPGCPSLPAPGSPVPPRLRPPVALRPMKCRGPAGPGSPVAPVSGSPVPRWSEGGGSGRTARWWPNGRFHPRYVRPWARTVESAMPAEAVWLRKFVQEGRKVELTFTRQESRIDINAA